MKKFLLLLLLILSLLSLKSYQRNLVWKAPLSLWEDNIKKAPLKARALNGLGLAYCDRGLIDKAIETLNRAVQVDPNHIKAYNNLGITYSKRICMKNL